MHDAIEFEKQGIPAVCICTEGFVPTAQAMAQLCGIPDYPFAVVKHPIGSLTDAELQQRANDAAQQAHKILVHGG